MKKENRTQIPILTVLIIVLVLFLLSFAIINFKGFARLCTHDMYEDTAYAMLAWNSKSIFPKGWVFGNQFYVIATPVLCALFYGLTGTINISMALATTVMTLLIVMSMLFLIRPFTDKVGCLAGVTAMVGCMITSSAATSLEGQLFYILASYYSCYLITVLIVLGDYLHTLCAEKKQRWSLILSMILCFSTGMQSLRQTIVLIIPLLTVEILRILFLLIRKEKKKIILTLSVTFRTLLYVASNLLGVLFIKILNIPNVTIYGETSFRDISQWGDANEVNIRIFQKITGFYYAFNEENGWLYLFLAVFFTGIVFLAAIVSLKKYIFEIRKGKSGEEHLLGLISFAVFSASIVQLLLINLLFDMNFRTPYLFVWYPFTAISCVVIYKYLKANFLKNTFIFLLCAALIGNWFTGYSNEVKGSIEQHEPSVHEKISDFIVKEGYTFIYGDWIVACPIAAYTNGKALAASFLGSTLEILEYINPQGVYGEDENRNAVYVFYGEQNFEALQYAEKIGANMTKVAEFDDGYYTLYISDKQLMHYGKSNSHN